MSTVLFQTMPPLSPDEYAQLEQSCLEHGIQVPILVDENGTVIDGHHRQKIAQEHGLYLPTETRDTLTDAEKTTLSISLNIDRRQLTREQRRAIIAASLRADPDLSDRGHAARTGVDHKTVGAVRRDLDQVGNFPTSEQERMRPDEVAALVRSGFVESADDLADIAGINAQTGEVIDAPTVTEHTVTEKVKTVTGLDGKTYTKPAPKPKPVATDDDSLDYDAKQIARRISDALQALDAFRVPAHRERVVSKWWPHAINNEEVPPWGLDLFKPEPIREIAQALTSLANEMEGMK